eukprot:SAG31_NODE_25932_length_451_cov_0.954545_1_plen_46_part_10
MQIVQRPDFRFDQIAEAFPAADRAVLPSNANLRSKTVRRQRWRMND